MCGIAGYLGTRRIEEAKAQACLRRMHHRGPDGSGIYRHEHTEGQHALLLHTRLAIIDLDKRAAQPMRHGAKHIVFNGELYNHLEVRAGLEAQGEQFDSTSDTEVLLRQLAVHGLDGLDGCEGMWAFALYDEPSGQLTLCRDRFGEKPLYILKEQGGIFFASEVKLLAELAGHGFEPNLDQLKRYLVNGYKSLYKGRETFFHGISEVGSGELVNISANGDLHSVSYWTPRPAIDETISYQDAVEGARERLIRSVELRLRADVPLAFCMSGGVDSNSLIAIARKVFDYDVHGFTIVNTDERYDEIEQVTDVVNQLGIQHTSIPLEQEGFLPKLRQLVRQHDAPVYTITYYAHWLLMQSVAEQGYKVTVSGTAADELFTGYYDHHAMYLAAIHGTDLFEESLANWKKHIGTIIRNPLLQDPLAFHTSPDQRSHIYLDADRFSSYLTEPFAESFHENDLHPVLLRKRMLNELFHEVTPITLHEEDLNAMSYSLENRSPFLDRGLFDFMNSVPTRHLIRDGFNKKILRDAMKGLVPESVLGARRKVGFNAPIFGFLDRKAPGVRDELLQDSPIFDIIRKEVVEQFLERPSLPNSDSKFLFYFLTSKLFLEECCGSSMQN